MADEITLGPWTLGMNNKAADHALKKPTRTDTSSAARNAVNVDFDNSGKARRRKGLTKVYDGLGTRCGFGCDLGEFFIESNKLKLLGSDNTAMTLYAGVSEGTFCYVDETLYFTDNSVALKISADGVQKWGMDPPAAPVLSATSGEYIAGTYQYCCCYVDANGVESGNSDLQTITVPADSGFIFSQIPKAPSGGAVRLYLSTANGTEMYHVTDTTASSLVMTAGRYDDGNIFDNYFVSPPPAGRIIGHYRGRMYIASGKVVTYSDPFSYDHFRLGENYILFPNDVDIMLPVKNGIIFCHGKRTDFYMGVPDDGFEIWPKFNYGGIYGTAKKIPNSDNVCWQSQRGMVIATPDGQCQNMQEDNVATETAVSGAALIKEKDGLRQFIAALQQPTTSPLAARSWIDAEIIRRG